MAIKGLINIEGLEVTGSYTNIDSFMYQKDNGGNYNINYSYSIYVNEEHRNKKRKPLHKGHDRVVFNDTEPVDIFRWMYGHLKANQYFLSGSLVDC
jgi:hypothetical protein